MLNSDTKPANLEIGRKMRFPQRAGKRTVAIIATWLACVVPAFAACETLRDAAATVCTVDPAHSDLRLFWQDGGGTPLAGFDRLAEMLAASGSRLAFAMNAGMFQPDLSPVGLYIEDGQQRRPVNLRASDGNFGLRPNGVFWFDRGRAGVMETSRFVASGLHPRFATQSGPMLVIGGRVHPKIRADGTSAKIRNGVGVCEDGRVRFAISDGPVTFYQFATLFRDRLRCPDALFLDGSISALYAPDLSRRDGWRPIGPIVGVVERK